MALSSGFNSKCPLFNTSNKGGVLYPFQMPVSGAVSLGMAGAIDLDGGVGSSSGLGILKVPMDCRYITCQLYAVADTVGVKSGAATTEPICVIRYWDGTSSVSSNSLLATITCDGAGTAGSIWTPGSGSTERDLSAGDRLVCYLSTAAATSSTSTLQDGGAVPVVWLALHNAP